MRILALDVGNTSVAAALFDRSPASGAPAATDHRTRGAVERVELDHWIALARTHAPQRIAVGSVHRFGEALAGALRAELPASVVHFDRGDSFPLAADVVEPAKVGVDRLAAALAAFTLAGGSAFVVGAGTAITVDWVDAARQSTPLFRGGAIVPGRRLQAHALHARTDRLPDVLPWGNPPPLTLPGRTTEEAIRHGLDVGIPGEVEALLLELERVAAAALPIFVSGGDAEWLAARLQSSSRPGLKLRREPFLVARGLALAAERTS